MGFLKRNKKWVGLVMAALTVYVSRDGCLGLEAYCETLKLALASLSSFLIGGGVLDSDLREKVVQGVVKPEEIK